MQAIDFFCRKLVGQEIPRTGARSNRTPAGLALPGAGFKIRDARKTVDSFPVGGLMNRGLFGC